VPSSKNYVRNIAQEDKTAKERGDQGTGHDSKSAIRHRARRKELKLGMVKPNQDVDHKIPIAKGGTNAVSNLRPRSVHANRSFPRTKDGGMK
jgi:5-methylcytosine-specific restriction endonuclease McrA